MNNNSIESEGAESIGKNIANLTKVEYLFLTMSLKNIDNNKIIDD